MKASPKDLQKMYKIHVFASKKPDLSYRRQTSSAHWLVSQKGLKFFDKNAKYHIGETELIIDVSLTRTSPKIYNLRTCTLCYIPGSFIFLKLSPLPQGIGNIIVIFYICTSLQIYLNITQFNFRSIFKPKPSLTKPGVFDHIL